MKDTYDAAITETGELSHLEKLMKAQIEDLEATCATMREALQALVDSGWSFNEFEDSMGVTGAFQTALAPDAGRDLLERLRRAEAITKMIENMTPGGSEFAGELDKCLEWIKERLATTAELAQRAKRAEAERVTPITYTEFKRIVKQHKYLGEAYNVLRFSGHIREVE